jgi:hypothetical protein
MSRGLLLADDLVEGVAYAPVRNPRLGQGIPTETGERLALSASKIGVTSRDELLKS